MKILVIGLEGAAPELLFGDERLTNVRRLMAYGCYGLLQGAASATAAPAWTCMATSRDRDSLAERGRPDGGDRAQDGTQMVDSGSVSEWIIWDQVMREGGRVILVDVPLSFPSRAIDGISVSFTMPVGSTAGVYTHPASVHQEIVELVGEYPLVVTDPGTEGAGLIEDHVRALSCQHYAVVRHLMRSHEWDCLQYVDSGLVRLHHSVWQHQDPKPIFYEPGNPHETVIRDYYRFLDGELGTVLEALDEDAIVSVVCLHGAQRRDQAQRGAFVLAASNSPLQGEIEGTHILDLAPTLLDLAGYDVPHSMQGRSLVAGQTADIATDGVLSEDDEEILRERLSGLGYIE